MKKKIKDLTMEEWKTLCHKYKKCFICPLRIPRPINEKIQRAYREREVEVDD